MEFYLDDCADADRLVLALTNAGHRVETPRSAGMSGRDDHEHLAYAAQNGFALITKNPDDYELLHAEWQAQGRAHHGIFLIYQDNIKGKDMGPADIVRAIGNLLSSGLPILRSSNHSIESKTIPRPSISASRSAACFFHAGVSRTAPRPHMLMKLIF